MADRIKKAEVESAFFVFTERAQYAGFDVSNWSLVKPDALGAHWRLFDVSVRPGEATHRYSSTVVFPEVIGSTNREAYDRLTAWSQCLDALYINRNGNN